jgi:hypothetical protein
MQKMNLQIYNYQQIIYKISEGYYRMLQEKKKTD